MRKYVKIIAFILMIFFVVMAKPMDAYADFGDFAGGDDYGDYGGGGDYDYDDDDSGGWIGGGGSSGGGSGGAMNTYVIPLLITGVVIWIIIRRSKSQTGPGAGGKGKMPAGASPTVGLNPINTIYSWDPDFSAEKIQQRLSNLYVQMQNCWTAKDITPLRGDFTDDQFAQFDRQLQRYRDECQTSVIERIAVLDVALTGVKQDETHDILVANLSTRFTSYTLDDKTGNIVRGNRNEEKFMRYEWTLIRPKGAKTAVQSKDATFNCPNCGGAMNINKSAKCPYCDSIIEKVDFDWVISGIKGLSQRTS